MSERENTSQPCLTVSATFPCPSRDDLARLIAGDLAAKLARARRGARAQDQEKFDEAWLHLDSDPEKSASTVLHAALRQFLATRTSDRILNEWLDEAEACLIILNHLSNDNDLHLDTVYLTLADLRSVSERIEHLVLRNLSKWYAAGMLSFPYKRLYLGDRHTAWKSMIVALHAATFAPHTERILPHNIRFSAKRADGSHMLTLGYGEGFCCFRHTDDDYHTMDVLVDLFQEPTRLAAKRSDASGSPLELWARDSVVLSSLKWCLAKKRLIDTETLREAFYAQRGVKECTQFKPSLAKAVFKHLNATRVLDFSAGWGDRLAAAIASDVQRYQAFDPNTALRAGHDELLQCCTRALLDARDEQVLPRDDDSDGPPTKRAKDDPEHRNEDTLGPAEALPCVRSDALAELQSRFNIRYEPFEVADLSCEAPDAFDLVFTSPPFFDFEVYTSLPGQSVATYTTLEQWLVRFLFVSLRKCWHVLADGGHVVLHITDVFKTRVCEQMCLLCVWLLPQCQYNGVICSVGGAGKARPLWVFKKMGHADANSKPSSDMQAKTSADGKEEGELEEGELPLQHAHVQDGDAAQAKQQLQKLYPATFKLVSSMLADEAASS